MILKFDQTCWACPEQYDVYDENGKEVGYIRFRWGKFGVYTEPLGETIYEAWPYEGEPESEWIGCFGETDGKREEYLKIAEEKIVEFWERKERERS